MANSLTSAFSRVIEDKRYLGFDESNTKINNRFDFFVAKKREFSGRYYEIQGPGGAKVPARFFYMRDRATEDVYGLHTPEQLPHFFVSAGAGAVPVVILTVAWNVAKMVVTMVHTVFEIFQEIYPKRHSVDVTKGFLERLQDKGVEKFDDIKECLQWIQKSLGFFVAIEAAVINALMSWKDEEVLFEMKVVVARVENLWNREASFRDSTYAQLTKFNKDLEARTKKDPKASKFEVINELLRDVNWKNFFSVSYIMQCFQSRGNFGETVTMAKKVETKDPLGFVILDTKTEQVKVPKFEIEEGTHKRSYKAFAEEMDRRDESRSWRIGL